MKILVDAREVHPHRAGIGRYIYNLFRDMEKASPSHRFSAVVMAEGACSLPPLLQGDTLEIPWNDFNRALKPVWDNILLARRFHNTGCDLMFAPCHFAPVFGKRIPVAAVIHDLTPFLFPQTFGQVRGSYLRFMMERLAHRARVISVPSENTKNDIVRRFKLDSDKIRVIYPSLGPITEAAIAENPVKAEKYILTVGTMEPRKNLPRLIRAYSRLPEDIRRGYPLVITGRTGWKSGGLQDMAARAGVAENVIFTGFIAESSLPAVFAGAAVFCYPSLYEGFGYPPLEAMYYGTPVLTSKVSSLPEVVGEAALMVNPESEEDIVAELLKLLTEESLRAKMREKGRIQARKFIDNGFAEKTLALFEEAAGG